MVLPIIKHWKEKFHPNNNLDSNAEINQENLRNKDYNK